MVVTRSGSFSLSVEWGDNLLLLQWVWELCLGHNILLNNIFFGCEILGIVNRARVVYSSLQSEILKGTPLLYYVYSRFGHFLEYFNES